ncbi:MAG TPA: hypothetical protein VFF04_04010 [Candidatus Babeliales bacterium]|nr:hypothetical protein [Candidatus Babeliales bacterium]
MKKLILFISLVLLGGTIGAAEILPDDVMTIEIGKCSECGDSITAAQTDTYKMADCGHMYHAACYQTAQFIEHCLTCGLPLKFKDKKAEAKRAQPKAEAPKFDTEDEELALAKALSLSEPRGAAPAGAGLRGRAASRVADVHAKIVKSGVNPELAQLMAQAKALRAVGSGAGKVDPKQCAHCNKALAHDIQFLNGKRYHAACKKTVQNTTWLKS